MKTEQTHTPTPWQANEIFLNNEKNRFYIRQKGWGGNDIADCGIVSEENESNAKFIVKAVNCHYDLLEACKSLIYNVAIPTSDHPWAVERRKAHNLAKQAIAKAESGV